jgi:hypothetical protein
MLVKDCRTATFFFQIDSIVKLIIRFAAVEWRSGLILHGSQKKQRPSSEAPDSSFDFG